MTWFEAEEFLQYVFKLEAALDEWEYDSSRMRLELMELDNIEKKIYFALGHRQNDKSFKILADDVLLRASFCRKEIRERLMV